MVTIHYGDNIVRLIVGRFSIFHLLNLLLIPDEGFGSSTATARCIKLLQLFDLESYLSINMKNFVVLSHTSNKFD